MKMGWGAVALLVGGLLLSSPSSAQQEFNGYPCSEDCSGHQAGYDWAESHGITDRYDCGGNSQSFIEGCESYAEQYGSPHDEEYVDDEESEESEYE